MKNKKVIIILMAVIFTAIAAAVCILYIKDAQIKSIKAENQNLIYSITEKNQHIYNLKQQIFSEESTILELNDNIAKLQSDSDDILAENERLYNLIESEDTNKNIENYFEKVAYLTFDDGPSYLTTRVLNLLDEYNIKATFFVIYTRYGDTYGLYKEIVDRGHAIGNHTYSHTSANDNPWEDFWEDFYKMEDYIYEKTGVRPKILRFPGGSTNGWNEDEEAIANIDKLHAMGYEYFDWNVTVGDGMNKPTAKEVFNAVVSRTYGGRLQTVVILMHDRKGNEATIDALPSIIQYLDAHGYTFLPLNEDSSAPHIFGTGNLFD